MSHVLAEICTQKYPRAAGLAVRLGLKLRVGLVGLVLGWSGAFACPIGLGDHMWPLTAKCPDYYMVTVPLCLLQTTSMSRLTINSAGMIGLSMDVSFSATGVHPGISVTAGLGVRVYVTP